MKVWDFLHLFMLYTVTTFRQLIFLWNNGFCNKYVAFSYSKDVVSALSKMITYGGKASSSHFIFQRCGRWIIFHDFAVIIFLWQRAFERLWQGLRLSFLCFIYIKFFSIFQLNCTPQKKCCPGVFEVWSQTASNVSLMTAKSWILS